MAEKIEMDKFLCHINADEVNIYQDRIHEELRLNKPGGKVVTPFKLTGIKAENIVANPVPFPRKKLTGDERSAMLERFYDIVKINIQPDPYDLLCKLFDEKNYETTTRIIVDALITTIAKHNRLQFSTETPYRLHQKIEFKKKRGNKRQSNVRCRAQVQS